MTDGQIFNADRKHAMRFVDHALHEGRIDIEDYEELTQAILDATTQAQLNLIIERSQRLSTTDLAPPAPAPRPSPAPQHGPAPRPGAVPATVAPEVQSTWFSNLRREGRWMVVDGSSYTANIGELVLDMREATASQPQVTITANAYVGNVRVVVSPGVGVISRIETVMAETKNKAEPHRPGMAHITLIGRCVMGTVKIISRQPGERLPFGFVNL